MRWVLDSDYKYVCGILANIMNMIRKGAVSIRQASKLWQIFLKLCECILIWLAVVWWNIRKISIVFFAVFIIKVGRVIPTHWESDY